MRWVLKTSHLIVGTGDGDRAYRSIKQCPPDILGHFKSSLAAADSCTIVIANREALESIRSQAIAAPSNTAQAEETARERFTMPRWQVLAGWVLTALAALVALLVWAMHG